MIEARELGKVYKVNHKQPGLKGAFANLFHAKWEQKVAVDGLSFQMEQGRALACIGENGAGNSVVFWFDAGGRTALPYTLSQLGQYARYPLELYPGVVRFLLLFLVPYGFICVVPVEILRGSRAWPWCFGVAGMSAGFFLLARAVFYRGIRHYESVGM